MPTLLLYRASSGIGLVRRGLTDYCALTHSISDQGSALVTLNRNETLFLNAMGVGLKASECGSY